MSAFLFWISKEPNVDETEHEEVGEPIAVNRPTELKPGQMVVREN